MQAEAYKAGHKQGCAEGRTQALEGPNRGVVADRAYPGTQWPPPTLGLSNDRGDGGDIRGAKMSTRRPQPKGLQLEGLLDRPGQLLVDMRLVGTEVGTGRLVVGLRPCWSGTGSSLSSRAAFPPDRRLKVTA